MTVHIYKTGALEEFLKARELAAFFARDADPQATQYWLERGQRALNRLGIAPSRDEDQELTIHAYKRGYQSMVLEAREHLSNRRKDLAASCLERAAAYGKHIGRRTPQDLVDAVGKGQYEKAA